MTLLSKTLKEAGFDGIFTEVNHAETLGLKNPNQLRMFHLDVTNNVFSFDALYSFLLKNIGRYVFSRAKMDQFQIEDDLEAVGARAIGLLRRASNLDKGWIDEELGNVMLYVFLEQILGAPKIFNKVELMQPGVQNGTNGGGVHLLALSDNSAPAYQLIFGKSKIVGDLQDGIDNAFELLKEIKDNPSDEMRIVENTVLSQAFDKDTVEYLKGIILPSKKKNAVVDKAFGVFLGYSLGLNPANYSNADFRKELMRKMDTDIKAHVTYIAQKIFAENMGAHSFYFYILPFNDADIEKRSIMNALLEGGA